jgi:isocitrate lyase
MIDKIKETLNLDWGKVLVPTSEAINKLVAARVASDVMGVPTIIIARTDADAAGLLTSDVDQRDHKFITGEKKQKLKTLKVLKVKLLT